MWQYNAKVLRVVDGDTYDVSIDLGFKIYHKIRIRLRGVNTPEVFGANAVPEGKLASTFVENIIGNQNVVITTYKVSPSTFNRWEADVSIQGVNLAEVIKANNHGVAVEKYL